MGTEKNNAKRVRLVVSGRVQGVYFRAHTRAAAEQLKLTGWVRNCKNGKVEALFEGDQNNIEAIIEICRKGPPTGRVADVEIKWEKPTDEFDGFEIKY